MIVATERLILREIFAADADFILNLLNQPSFIRYIGDRGVKNRDDARRYIENRFAQSYRKFGFGLYAVARKTDETPLGICGFVKRDALPAPDIGFAFLPEFWSQGYAFEAARAALDYGKNVLKFENVLAITSKDNEISGKLLEKLGFEFQRTTKLSDAEDAVKLFSINL